MRLLYIVTILMVTQAFLIIFSESLKFQKDMHTGKTYKEGLVNKWKERTIHKHSQMHFTHGGNCQKTNVFNLKIPYQSTHRFPV